MMIPDAVPAGFDLVGRRVGAVRDHPVVSAGLWFVLGGITGSVAWIVLVAVVLRFAVIDSLWFIVLFFALPVVVLLGLGVWLLSFGRRWLAFGLWAGGAGAFSLLLFLAIWLSAVD